MQHSVRWLPVCWPTTWRTLSAALALTMVASNIAVVQAQDDGARSIRTPPTNDIREVVEAFQRAAEAGDPSSMTKLAWMYQRGMGVSPDIFKAVRWYLEAADRGHVLAMSQLAYLYLEGPALFRNEVAGVRWLTKAANAGDLRSITNLGVAYRDSRGTVRNYTEAARLFRQAADLGDTKAAINLGLAYRDGLGMPPDRVPQDQMQARSLFSKAGYLGDDAGTLLTAEMDGFGYQFGNKVIHEDRDVVLGTFEQLARRSSNPQVVSRAKEDIQKLQGLMGRQTGSGGVFVGILSAGLLLGLGLAILAPAGENPTDSTSASATNDADRIRERQRAEERRRQECQYFLNDATACYLF